MAVFVVLQSQPAASAKWLVRHPLSTKFAAFFLESSGISNMLCRFAPYLQANLFAKESSDGQLLLEAADGLPLVLISTPGTTPECVWRGIEVGAAEVLEKPLSLLKLQNIWQHVVRKVRYQSDNSSSQFK